MKLVIDNSYSQMQGMTPEVFRKLKKELSYLPDAYNAFSGFPARPRYLIDAKGFFPTGLAHRVLEYTLEAKLKCDIEDRRRLPVVKVDHKPQMVLTAYPAQRLALNALLGAHRGVCSLPTGSGKSQVISMAIAALKLRTLIVVPNLELKRQLTESLTKDFGNTTHICVENIDSNRLNTLKDFDLLIIDECHHTAAKTYQTLNKKQWGGIYYRLMLTATAFRNRTEETLLFEGIAGQVIYKLSYQEAVKESYIVPIEAYYLEVAKTETDAVTWPQVYSQLVVNHTERNLMIGALLLRLNQAALPSLCLVKEVAHGKILSELTGLPFVHGQDEESRQYIHEFNKGSIKTLIGTEGLLSEGVDTKPCQYVIVAGLGKAKSQLMQKIGRGVRKYPGKDSCKVILVRDLSHKFTRTHFNEQKKIIKDEYGVTVLKLEI